MDEKRIEIVSDSSFVATPNRVRRVLTYGTYDLLHYGHIRLLQRARALGDYLVVALSTDEFNAIKGKKSFYPYETRREMLEAIRYVDLVIPESDWGQKRSDVQKYDIDVVCMGGDWAGDPRFEDLRDLCEVVYLDRTQGISTTEVKERLGERAERAE
jgi:glycerol-3-phosphate cytidylyltransferase